MLLYARNPFSFLAAYAKWFYSSSIFAKMRKHAQFKERKGNAEEGGKQQPALGTNFRGHMIKASLKGKEEREREEREKRERDCETQANSRVNSVKGGENGSADQRQDMAD